jgi:hypothetical protein
MAFVLILYLIAQAVLSQRTYSANTDDTLGETGVGGTDICTYNKSTEGVQIKYPAQFDKMVDLPYRKSDSTYSQFAHFVIGTEGNLAFYTSPSSGRSLKQLRNK